MRVRIEVTVDIDTQAWRESFGTDPSELRADIKTYAEHLLRRALEEQDLLQQRTEVGAA